MEIAIHGQGSSAPFDLVAAKDFDWSVVTRLNERLPAGPTGRFAAFFDGNAIIVYLTPDQIEALGKVFGHDFISEIKPLEERLPPHGPRQRIPSLLNRCLSGQWSSVCR
ncbi:hypothetical protein KIP88_18800 [Bradyrhizobium sp. SRL28]|uniref:hypothetical protein n=1 Tax=Bradyrhizobium sp. SRL28 TaxID=2836178 RepID=UPI001BDECD9F|nr:hypothetical protein [Bradyrhizobium sp. SRL28]MBT1512556.1 hypothetical protein [Bradyrhizobium sp. SRL28]